MLYRTLLSLFCSGTLSQVESDIRRENGVKGPVQLVSKQSRPFLMFKIVQCVSKLIN